MNLILTRTICDEDGCFSVLTMAENGGKIAECLEHAYADDVGIYVPKLPNGKYICIRGKHRLHGMTSDFETFEITGVKGHTNILFHVGNFSSDSDGCVLLGENTVTKDEGKMITNSKVTFAKFMELQGNLNSFYLTVK